MKERWQALAASLVPVGVTVFLFHPLLLAALTGAPRFLEWDVPEQYWPDLVYLCSSLHDGVLPYWNPYDRAGYPYYADPQAGIYNPLNWAICAVAGASPGLGWAEARVVLGFLVSGLAGMAWLRRWRLPWGSAVLGATVLEVAPFMRHNWELNLTGAFAWTPLVLWAADRAVVERRASDGALLALALAMCAWVGSPPALWLCLSFAAPFVAWRLAEETVERGRAALGRGLLVLLLSSCLAAGLAGAVVGPGLMLARESVQAGRGLDSVAEGGLAAGQLLGLVRPLPGNHLYLGLVVLILGAVGLAAPRLERPVPARWYMLIASVVAVLMAMGTNGPLFGPVFNVVPGVSLFRLPHRYESWLGPAWAALSAAGLAWLGSPRVSAAAASRVVIVRAGSAACALAGIILAFAGSLTGAALVLASAGVVGLAATFPRLGASHFLTGAVLSALLVLDVSRTLPPDRHTVPGPPPGSAAAAAPLLDIARSTDNRYRYMDEFGISLRSGTRFGRRDFRGYQDPLLLKSYERVLSSLRERPALVEEYGVRFVLTGPHFIHGWNRHFLPPPSALLALPGAIDRGRGVIELPGALPPAFWVDLSQVEKVPDRPAALERVAGLAPGPIAILDGAVTGGSGAVRHGGPAGDPSWVEADSYVLSRDAVSLVVDAPRAGMVVVNEAWYPGWRATVDGVSRPVFRANALVRAVPVGPGRHRIRMEFRPAGGALLRWTLVASLIASLAVLAASALNGRASGRAAASGRHPLARSS